MNFVLIINIRIAALNEKMESFFLIYGSKYFQLNMQNYVEKYLEGENPLSKITLMKFDAFHVARYIYHQ